MGLPPVPIPIPGPDVDSGVVDSGAIDANVNVEASPVDATAGEADSSDSATTPDAAGESDTGSGETDADGGDAGPSCKGDSDCPDRGLCVWGQCRSACMPRTSGELNPCPAGETCVMGATPNGGCYLEPGCNPPPPGVVCPCFCVGYCQ